MGEIQDYFLLVSGVFHSGEAIIQGTFPSNNFSTHGIHFSDKLSSNRLVGRLVDLALSRTRNHMLTSHSSFTTSFRQRDTFLHSIIYSPKKVIQKLILGHQHEQ